MRMFLEDATLASGRPLLASLVVNRLRREIDLSQYQVESFAVVDDRAFIVAFSEPGAAAVFPFALAEVDFEVIAPELN